MQENWQFGVTTFVALLALYNSFKARKEARKANELAEETQRRNDFNQYYPSLKFTADIDNEQISFFVKNNSQDRETRIEEIRYSVIIKAGKANLSDENSKIIGETLVSDFTMPITCNVLNQHIESMRNAIFNTDPDNVTIFVRAWLESKPAIYECKAVCEHLEATFSHEDGKLKLIKCL
ncbi:hypothetical protein [Aliivibrio sp. S10_S31]|uniref:hypothetical protein n=1 Tax=Aliivibrio sp. S10_S31 TaxID=2720224 RepID=UPI001680995E|nr:hypothetical protein [Aliivibrio sp. S10_S31]MBD1571537.1 hypothetical protein [Aliivibrio sp. S10_S31]